MMIGGLRNTGKFGGGRLLAQLNSTLPKPPNYFSGTTAPRLIMEAPAPLPAKHLDPDDKTRVLPSKSYVVTGDREVTTVLTVHADGRWELAKGTLYDVTHLPCRSARYTPAAAPPRELGTKPGACSPSAADQGQFPVRPGAAMPAVPGCTKQDYAVLFVLGEEI